MSGTATPPKPRKARQARAPQRRPGIGTAPVTKRPKPIPGVEIREYRGRGVTYYRFRVRYLNAAGVRRQETFDQPGDAIDFKAKLRLMTRSDALDELDIGKETLVEFMPEFWRLYAKRTLAEVTRRKYRGNWNKHILPRPIAHMPMRKITPLVLTEYIAELEDDGVSIGVIRVVLGMLQSMFRRAVEWGKASGNVVKEIQKPRVPRKRAVIPITTETVERIRRAMLMADPERGLRDATIVSILGYTGMRPEEVLALECDHPKEKTILVEQKVSLGVVYQCQKVAGRPPRSPRLFTHARADIAAYRLAFGIGEGLLFSLDGEPWSQTAYNNWRKRYWQPACVAVGIGRIESYRRKDGGFGKRYTGAIPYDLRHSFASLLIHEGELSIVEIANQLGHSTETLLRVYAHVIAEMEGKPRVPAEKAIALARKKVHGAGAARGVPSGVAA
jgi:integrase